MAFYITHIMLIPATPASGAAALWDFAHSRRTSQDPRALMEAGHAVLMCKRFLLMREEMALFVSGGQSLIEGPLSPDRQLAYAELNARCDGFVRASPAQVNALRLDLDHRLQALAPDVWAGNHGKGTDGPQKLAMLLSGSASEIEKALPHVARDLADRRGLTDRDSPERSDIFAAATLAGCALGTDCSSHGFNTLFQCVMNGACSSYLQELTAGLPEARLERVDRYRQLFIQAVTRSDVGLMGLAYR